MELPDIFKPTGTHKFVACVGTNGFTDGQTYAEGFFESAQCMLDQIYRNKADGPEMDLLVYPILYSIRHGIELSLKHLLRKLSTLPYSTIDIKKLENHNLDTLWQTWKEHAPFDRRLNTPLENFGDIVNQIHKVDPSGQEFRYHLDRDDNRTLADKWSVDLVSVAKLLEIIQNKLKILFPLIDQIVEEREMGSFTSKFNRVELMQLSRDLPDHNTWAIEIDRFLAVKKDYRDRLGVGSNKLNQAIDFIKSHPEFAGNIGIESQPKHLTEADFLEITAKYIERLEQRSLQKGIRELTWLELNSEHQEEPVTDYQVIATKLSAAAIGEFRALADMGRQNHYSENFENLLVSLTPLDNEKARIIDFRHFYTKTNLLPSLVSGLRKIGSRSLSQKIENAQKQFQMKHGKSAEKPIEA